MIRITLAVVLMALPLGSFAQQPDQGEPMKLREAIFLALQNNLEIQLARYEPAIAEQGVEQARGVFDPQISAFGGFEHEETPTVSIVESFFDPGRDPNLPPIPRYRPVESDYWTYSGGFGGILPFGLEYSSSYTQLRSDSGSALTGLYPEFRGIWESTVTLPLLKDLFDNPANIAVKRSRAARDFSDERFRQQLTDLVLAVEVAYWDLAAARAEDRVARKSLHTAQDLLEQTRVQYQVGVVSKVAVTQAEAGVAEREVQAIGAKNTLETAHDVLLNTILAPEARVFSERWVIPEDPTYTDYVINETIALQKAMALRPELAQSRKLVEDAELQLALAENQVLPSLDLEAGYRSDGLAGTPKTSGIGNRAGEVVDDYFRASGAHSWSTGIQFSIPFPNTTARATEVQSRIALRRAHTQLRRTEQEIILDVREAARVYRNSVEAYEAAERRRIAQQETLAAEQERLRLGDSTPFQVLEFEQDLAEAERQVIFSLELHRNAISGLERAQGTLLERHGITVDDQLLR